MQRREFIKITTIGITGAILVPSLLSSCNSSSSSALEGWQGPASDQTDIRMLVLSYAILAANPHNKQPWIIDLKSPTEMDLYVDQTRLLPETDPPARQIHIGQGAFLENLVLAAQHYGYEAQIRYFPQGMYSNTEVLHQPVAGITLKPGKKHDDPLFSMMLHRQSNKRVYESDRSLTSGQIQSFKDIFRSKDYALQLTQDLGTRKEIAAILTEAMKIETRGHARHIETMKMFRLNNWEIEKYRDGFGIAQLGMTGLKGWIAEKFFLGTRQEIENPESSASQSGMESATNTTQEQAESASAFGWIVSKTNTRLDQVKVGQAYQRVNLETTRLGLGQHPMSQVLQEYEEMAGLQKEFLKLLKVPSGHTVQMLFRLGYAEEVIHSPRRRIIDFTS